MCHHLLLAQFTCSDVSDFLSSTVSLPGLLSCFPHALLPAPLAGEGPPSPSPRLDALPVPGISQVLAGLCPKRTFSLPLRPADFLSPSPETSGIQRRPKWALSSWGKGTCLPRVLL